MFVAGLRTPFYTVGHGTVKPAGTVRGRPGRTPDGAAAGDREGARRELLKTSALVEGWYDDLAGSLLQTGAPPTPLAHDRIADARLVDAVRRDLSAADGRATATAVRMIWTADHLDAARRLQGVILEPARSANDR